MSWDSDNPFPSSAALGETDSGARNLSAFLCSLLIPGPVLVIGSSELALAAAEHHEVTVVDWNHRRLHRLAECARSRGLSLRLECRDLQREDLVVSRDGVQNVVCVDVLERLRSDLAVLQKLRRAIPPSGQLIVRVRGGDWVQARDGGSSTSVRSYTEQGLQDALELAGFRVQRMRYWNFVGIPFSFFWDRWLKRPRRDRGGIPSSEQPRGTWDVVMDGWYRRVEGRVAFPAGVSLIAVATPHLERVRLTDRVPARRAARRNPEAEPLAVQRFRVREDGLV
ncbi:MAG: hypothetical protein DHS20C21_14500 [Gemmatimonadota bacterium]|nr:MAG: hypothetical protein DHS20C21_14500 [Gemmatimonadota bacterium]